MSHYFGYRGFVTGEIGINFPKGGISATGTNYLAGQHGTRGGNLARAPRAFAISRAPRVRLESIVWKLSRRGGLRRPGTSDLTELLLGTRPTS
ncbi:hypothetical protein Sinac_3525 [Singulisphaera acidiphila DSM 18658]|uniref:Uncharacterized protein n=1 Tax=Singulisphaera acidiphila (strain ATCC BAA-1392 / DSM 18658 / VKM B-2454 / MOB10) TaxID=886293 RepID=L0DGH3_SINAD|nr:hypothetical protein Sinac_3525 [Singulisphaera acidiphila DSM 18658]